MLFTKVRIHRILAVLLLVLAMVAVAVPPAPSESPPSRQTPAATNTTPTATGLGSGDVRTPTMSTGMAWVPRDTGPTGRTMRTPTVTGATPSVV